MKNIILRKVSNLQNSILYVLSFCLLTLLFFIIILYENKNVNSDNTATILAGGIIAFLIIFGLIYKLKKDIKLGNNAKDDLAANEIKYHNLIENAGIVMYTTSLNGMLTFASSKAMQLTDYSMNELIGMHYSDIIDAE